MGDESNSQSKIKEALLQIKEKQYSDVFLPENFKTIFALAIVINGTKRQVVASLLVLLEDLKKVDFFDRFEVEKRGNDIEDVQNLVSEDVQDEVPLVNNGTPIKTPKKTNFQRMMAEANNFQKHQPFAKDGISKRKPKYN
eukprot:TRINITY_DN2400_c0_g1_i2.p1 TRINITY_DN2400_c0_g1~~TRINITY_DN2400_c0_g1_i2.p1  ORF type:complete len:140 (-),score=41.79 TRINITY_DN2400_c0_g1_i2:24-443(-)